MCRIYRSKDGDYVRLCYRHGARRGERIPFFSLPPDVSTDLLEGKIIHVPKERKPKAAKSYNKSLWKRQIPRCRKCKAPLNRANYQIGICYVCQEGK
jgi:hypothetical protein